MNSNAQIFLILWSSECVGTTVFPRLTHIIRLFNWAGIEISFNNLFARLCNDIFFFYFLFFLIQYFFLFIVNILLLRFLFLNLLSSFGLFFFFLFFIDLRLLNFTLFLCMRLNFLLLLNHLVIILPLLLWLFFM